MDTGRDIHADALVTHAGGESRLNAYETPRIIENFLIHDITTA